MKKKWALIFFAALAFVGCGGRGAVLSTPKNQAGTRAVVLPGYTPAAPAAENLAPAAVAGEAAVATEASAAEAVSLSEPAPAFGVEAAIPAEGARKKAAPGEIDLEIREKMFIAQTNDVYLNPEDYLGKTIKLEGLFKIDQYVGAEKEYCFVLRYGPGCCGNDGSAGFEVAWGSPQAYAGPETVNTLPSGPAYPVVDAWVEAVGVLDTYEEDGYPYIYLDLLSLTEKEDRGAEFVSQ
jgi:hypothetical protein